MSTVYRSYAFETAPIWEHVPVGAIDRFHWESGAPYRPKSFFQLCFVKGEGVRARLWTDETDVRAVCTERDGPVWEDSCLECFFEPAAGKGYLNVEMNPRGVFLAQWGKAREDRVFTRELTALSPAVAPLPQQAGWGVSLFVPCALLEALGGAPFNAAAGDYRFCCFKCGDKTARPHWASFAPMGGNPPGFHAPEHFATLEIREFQP
jgi:hypothetical protein